MTSVYQVQKELHTKFCNLLDNTIMDAKKAADSDEWNELRFAQTMHSSVNAERIRMGKSEVELDLIVRVERTALGHIDYVEKFALYCVELVLDTSPLQAKSS